MASGIEKLTPLGVLLLALLNEGDMHPYEMRRLLCQRSTGRLAAVTTGTVYNTVARLDQAGLIEAVGVEREGNRPERTTYRVLPAGREAVAEWVRHELPRIDRPAQFRVALAEAHNLGRAEAADLLRTRHAAVLDELEQLRARLAAAHAKGVPAQVLVELERSIALQDADRSWLEELLDRLSDNTFAWGFGENPDETPLKHPAQRERHHHD